MAKKKKMSKAQAASARKEMTQRDVAKLHARERKEELREMQKKAQEEKKKGPVFGTIIFLVVVLAIAGFAALLTVGPGIIAK
ncbi:MAG: hypothetical protein E7Z99_05885 [Coriobacteriaceae bacterium]|nr:hypothetical protein [Coriobacteriaceae bacterium]